MPSRVEFLQSIPYFSMLRTSELERLDRLLFEKSYDRGEVITLEGELSQAIYFIYQGKVKIYKSSADGKEQVLNILVEGDSFHDISAFDGGPTPAGAQAQEPSVLYGLRRADMMAIIRDYPVVAASVIKVLARKTRHLVAMVEDLSFRPVIGRLSKLLLEYTDDSRADIDGIPLKEKLTHQQMASMVGTSREVIGRSLKHLEEMGAIRSDHRNIFVLDKKHLRRMA